MNRLAQKGVIRLCCRFTHIRFTAGSVTGDSLCHTTYMLLYIYLHGLFRSNWLVAAQLYTHCHCGLDPTLQHTWHRPHCTNTSACCCLPTSVVITISLESTQNMVSFIGLTIVDSVGSTFYGFICLLAAVNIRFVFDFTRPPVFVGNSS